MQTSTFSQETSPLRKWVGQLFPSALAALMLKSLHALRMILASLPMDVFLMLMGVAKSREHTFETSSTEWVSTIVRSSRFRELMA
jgi:hypothetical protein